MTRPSLTFSHIAELYGISTESLLLYEREGIVVPFRVDDNRYFTVKDKVRIEIILKGAKLGFSLSEIKALIFTHLPPAQALDRSQIEARIADLEDEKQTLQLAIDDLRATLKPEA